MIERPTSILLVDDHRVFADVLSMRLRGEPEVIAVEVAYSLDDARSLVNRFRADVVLLDFQLADECGLELLPDIDGLAARPDVLVLSGLTDTSSIVDALEVGVQGWVSKDASFDVLLLATAEVVRGHMYLPPTLVKPVVRQLLSEARGPRPGGALGLRGAGAIRRDPPGPGEVDRRFDDVDAVGEPAAGLGPVPG